MSAAHGDRWRAASSGSSAAEPKPVIERITRAWPSGRELQLVEPAVEPARLAQQLLVAALLAHLAALEHHDAVRASRTVVRRCAITSVVRPRIRLASACCTSRSDSASSAEVASSRIRIGGSFRIARAIAMRCFWPPESRLPRSPITVS